MHRHATLLMARWSPQYGYNLNAVIIVRTKTGIFHGISFLYTN